MLINIDFDNINEELVYEAFSVDGNESEALNDMYLELYELIGRDAMLKSPYPRQSRGLVFGSRSKRLNG